VLTKVVPDVTGLTLAWRHISVALGCVVIPVALVAAFFFFTATGEDVKQPAFGWDFQPIWLAAGDVLEGESPYPAPTRAALDGEDQFVYPPGPAVAAIPFRLFSFEVATVLFGLLLVASVVLTLRVLNVRDWRCYGIVFTWVPVLASIRLGAISILLTLGTALAWRYRDHAYLGAAAVAAIVAAKLFLWPLALWLAVTGRVRQAALAAGAALGVTFASWAVIGFQGLRDYGAMLETLSDVVGPKSYSLAALSRGLGLSESAEQFLPALVGGAGLIAVILIARRPTPDRDSRALIVALAAALALSPIVWTHYFALLIVPIALASPRLGPIWLLPVLFWLSPDQNQGDLWRICVGVAVTSVVFAAALGVSLPRPFRSMRLAFPSARA
jgi:Glycosyltransferase family 87